MLAHGLPTTIALHVAASNIHDGMTTPDPSCHKQTCTCSPEERDSRYRTSTSPPNAGCHA